MEPVPTGADARGTKLVALNLRPQTPQVGMEIVPIGVDAKGTKFIIP